MSSSRKNTKAQKEKETEPEEVVINMDNTAGETEDTESKVALSSSSESVEDSKPKSKKTKSKSTKRSQLADGRGHEKEASEEEALPVQEITKRSKSAEKSKKASKEEIIDNEVPIAADASSEVVVDTETITESVDAIPEAKPSKKKVKESSTKELVKVEKDVSSVEESPAKVDTKPVKGKTSANGHSHKKDTSSEEEPSAEVIVKPKGKASTKKDTSSEEEPPAKVITKPKGKSSTKKDDSSEEEPPVKVVAKPKDKASTKKDSSSEEEPPAKVVAKPKGKATTKKDISSEEEPPAKVVAKPKGKVLANGHSHKKDSSSEEELPAKLAKGKALTKNDSSSEEEPPVKRGKTIVNSKTTVKRGQPIKQDSSSNDEPPAKKITPKGKASIKEDSSSADEPPVKRGQDNLKSNSKIVKADTSSEESVDEPKKSAVKSKPKPKGKNTNSSGDESDASSASSSEAEVKTKSKKETIADSKMESKLVLIVMKAVKDIVRDILSDNGIDKFFAESGIEPSEIVNEIMQKPPAKVGGKKAAEDKPASYYKALVKENYDDGWSKDKSRCIEYFGARPPKGKKAYSFCGAKCDPKVQVCSEDLKTKKGKETAGKAKGKGFSRQVYCDQKRKTRITAAKGKLKKMGKSKDGKVVVKKKKGKDSSDDSSSNEDSGSEESSSEEVKLENYKHTKDGHKYHPEHNFVMKKEKDGTFSVIGFDLENDGEMTLLDADDVKKYNKLGFSLAKECMTKECRKEIEAKDAEKAKLIKKSGDEAPKKKTIKK